MYLRERPHDVPDAAKMSWWAPLVIARENSFDFYKHITITWMKNKKELDINDLPGEGQFIIVNPEEIGKSL